MSAEVIDLGAARARRQAERAAGVASAEKLRAWLERITRPEVLGLLAPLALLVLLKLASKE